MEPSGPRIPTRLSIGSLDNPTAAYTVTAHYNPKDIDLAHQANWDDEQSLKGMVKKKRIDVFNDLQYTGTPARTMSMELFLDDVEKRFDVQDSVETTVAKLHTLATPRDETIDAPEYLRPHLCVVAWGHGEWPSFVCVIESIAVKYTMFSVEGVPLRATCCVKLKEIRTGKRIELLDRYRQAAKARAV